MTETSLLVRPATLPIVESALHAVPVLESGPAALEQYLSKQEGDITPEQKSRFHKLGKGAVIRAGVEVAGVGVDAVLMGAGKAGFDVMRGVVTREITATAPEIALLDKILHRNHSHETSVEQPSRLKKLGGKVLSLALGIGTAVAAQKFGPALVNHVHSSLNHGVGEFVVPITSKVGALSGLNAARSKIRPRFTR